MKKYWFKAKHYGYGWYPASWEGWIVTFAGVGAILLISLQIDETSQSVNEVLLGISLPILAVAALLVWIAYLTGEKPGWRWGKRK